MGFHLYRISLQTGLKQRQQKNRTSIQPARPLPIPRPAQLQETLLPDHVQGR
jgi:hypothetical protein